jgi:hypothetical protein
MKKDGYEWFNVCFNPCMKELPGRRVYGTQGSRVPMSCPFSIQLTKNWKLIGCNKWEDIVIDYEPNNANNWKHHPPRRSPCPRPRPRTSSWMRRRRRGRLHSMPPKTPHQIQLHELFASICHIWRRIPRDGRGRLLQVRTLRQNSLPLNRQPNRLQALLLMGHRPQGKHRPQGMFTVHWWLTLFSRRKIVPTLC